MDVNFLNMMEARLPPGFRFHPRDEELIDDYLARRIAGDQSNGSPLMVDVDLNQVEPWDLPATARVGKEWYFYSQRDRKYATGQRTNRATRSGYWKATGKDRHVADDRRGGTLMGMRKTLVFYKGRAPKGKKTDWVMHEFRRLEADPDLDLDLDRPRPLPHSPSSTFSARKEDWVLCRVFYKSRGLSPKPNTTGFCYDDGASSSSLPPLTDTYINFEQRQPLGNGFNEQVPCFSSIPRHPSPAAVPAFSHTQPPHLLSDVKSLPLPPDQLGSSSTLPGVGPSFLHNPLMSFSSGTDNSGDAVLDHICKGEVDGGTAGEDLGISSGSFLAQAGPHSMWNPF